MRLLVTGGAGFIGANLLHYWANLHPDDSLICLDSLTYAGHLESIKGLVEEGKVSFLKGDIRDRETVLQAMKDVDAVVHLAAETHVDRSISDPEAFLKTNVIGTMVLLEAARKVDIPRFHHVSTDEVFGSLELDSSDRFSEESPYRPNSPYAASKAAADHLVRAYGTTYGLPFSMTNCGNNYGPYQHPEKLIPRFVSLLLSERNVPLYGDGLNVRDWIFVEDHCSAIDAVVRGGTSGVTYLVSGRHEISNIDLTKTILKSLGLGINRIDHVPDRLGHDRRYALDDTKLRSEIGWKPKVTMEEGLARTIAWYRANVEWWKPLLETQ